MALEFLTPVNSYILDYVDSLSQQHLGKKTVFHTNLDFPDLKKISIAIIGVLENRGDNSTVDIVQLDFIRKELYSLYPGNWIASIADLGDIKSGDSINDTYFALQKVINFLLKNNIIPIVIGGTQDLTYSLYRAFDDLDQMVNLVCIDSKFDFGKEDNNLSKDSYLSKIIIDQPNNLFNFSNVGYQSYYNSQEEIDLIEKLFFDAYRLGEISNNITISEPVFRDADIVSIDMHAVVSSASGNNLKFSPNGLNGKEICSLARYSGISDKISVFGIFNHNNSSSESQLISQIIWYFIEGYHHRSKEFPFSSKLNFFKYTVLIEDQEVIFYKSDKSERWWIEIPFISNVNNKLKKSTLLPCSYEEYLGACNQEIPQRWWKAQRKNTV